MSDVFQLSTTFLNGKYSGAACKGQYTRSLKFYKAIVVYENFTGGGGDGDGSAPVSNPGVDSLATIKARIERMKKRGEDVITLTPKLIDNWHKLGWFGLFNSRYVIIIDNDLYSL